MENTKRITALLEDLFSQGLLSDCFVVDVVQNGGLVTVFFDSDSGVTFEKCKQVSKYLEKHLEEERVLSRDYVLDVSSPGVDRPLKFWRQYPRHLNRRLSVRLKDGSAVDGKMTEIGIDGFSLEIDKKKQVNIEFSDIEESFVQISF